MGEFWNRYSPLYVIFRQKLRSHHTPYKYKDKYSWAPMHFGTRKKVILCFAVLQKFCSQILKPLHARVQGKDDNHYIVFALAHGLLHL